MNDPHHHVPAQPLHPAVHPQNHAPAHPQHHAPVHPQQHPVHPQPHPVHRPAPGGLQKVAGVPIMPMPKDDLSSIALDDDPTIVEGSNKIRAFGVKDIVSGKEYKRTSNLSGNGAVHIKSFHGRLSDEGKRCQSVSRCGPGR